MIDIRDKGIKAAIESRLLDMHRMLRTVMGSGEVTDLGAVVSRASWFASALAGEHGYTAGHNVAQGLLELLVPQAEQRERVFWATPLGGVLAWWSGGEGSTVRRSVIAEAATGLSRQAIHKMIVEGHLIRDEDIGDVTADSLSAMLQRRYPHEVTA